MQRTYHYVVPWVPRFLISLPSLSLSLFMFDLHSVIIHLYNVLLYLAGRIGKNISFPFQDKEPIVKFSVRSVIVMETRKSSLINIVSTFPFCKQSYVGIYVIIRRTRVIILPKFKGTRPTQPNATVFSIETSLPTLASFSSVSIKRQYSVVNESVDQV